MLATTMMMAVCHAILLLFATTLPAVVNAAEAEATLANGNDLVELTHYHVTTNVESRLLKTTIDMTFRRLPVDTTVNGTSASCGPVIHTMTLQLPRLARVQSLEMDLSNGCQLDSQVQELEQAKDTFDDMASSGKPAALLTAWDMSNYKLQIVLPPLPAEVVVSDNNATNVTIVEEEPKPTTVRLTYTELLVQKNHQVDFQLPVFPGVAVSELLQVDLTIQDQNAGILELNLDDSAGTNGRKLSSPLAFNVTQRNSNKLALAHFEESNLPEDSAIPRLIRGFFRPAALPEAGVLTIPLLEDDGKDEVCFTHVFNPSDFLKAAGSLPKNIVFVIDTSGSMSGERLDNAKVAFASMVNALVDEKDSFRVQTFASSGTEVLWGPAVASAAKKQEAIQLVQSLEAGGGTNLHDAYLEGISYTSPWMYYDVGTATEAVPILVVLSDGEASAGITDRSAIARNVKEANTGGRVKIFSLAFGEYADVDLLTGIALQNGGKVLQIYEGYGDTVQQMEDFYQQELEQIVLSDIDISYFKNADAAVGVASAAFLSPLSILDITSSSFPTLAEGSECIVRGKVSRSELPTNTSLQASVSALSAVGNQDWSQQYDFSLPMLDDNDNANPPPLIVNDCEQAFAHARIEELLTYRNAQRALGGNDLTGVDWASLEKQARKIAIEAKLVWPGLTALVTVENPDCPQVVAPQTEGNEEEAQVCYSGESSSGDSAGGGWDEAGNRGSGGYYSSMSSGATIPAGSWWFIATLLSFVFIVLIH